MLMIWLLAMLAFAGTAARADYPARPDGPVLDAANLIPDAEEPALIERLSAYNQTTGRAITVVTVPSLDGQDDATYANTLARNWGIGGKASDQGLLFLIAPVERKIRLEVGYGLEGQLPDVLAGRIIRDTVRPRFRDNDYIGGINAGLDAITAQLDRDPAEATAIAEAAAAAEASRGDEQGGASFAGVIGWLVFMVFVISLFGRGSRRRGIRRSGIDPGIVLWGISEAMRHGSSSGGNGGFGGFGGGGGGGSDWGGFGGGDFGGGGASGDW